MDGLERFLENPRTLRTSGALTLLGFAGMFFLLRLGSVSGAEVVDLQTTFSAIEFRAILSNWGEAGTRAFLSHYWIDAFHAVCYSIFLSSLYTINREKSPETRPDRGLPPRLFLLLPFFACFADWVENAVDLSLVLSPEWPDAAFQSWVTVGATAARAKWSGIFISLLGTGSELLKRTVLTERRS